MKALTTILLLFTSMWLHSQCINDVCEDAIELDLCTTENLSENCLSDWEGGTINLYGTGSTGGV